MTLQEATIRLQSELSTVYESREAANITDWVLEQLTGYTKSARIIHKQSPLTALQQTNLASYTSDLLRHRPVQYVLGEAWFHGFRFYVNENVLIPRPETEELVNWIVEEHRLCEQPLRILDIGTGSGCIPISIQKSLPGATVYACDISEGALGVAQKNASDLNAAVRFIQLDILDPDNWQALPEVDIIVSNPPYIPVKDKSSMHPNVLEHEPHLALFVSDEDPLTFYKAIAGLAQSKLSSKGELYVEIHEDLGAATLELFQQKGFSRVTVKKDMQGKERMIKAAALISR